MPDKITREQAESVLRQVEAYYQDCIEEGYGPKLEQDWDGLDSGPRDWAVTWMDGPDEWAYFTATEGDTVVDDEEGVHMEAATFQVLALYPA